VGKMMLNHPMIEKLCSLGSPPIVVTLDLRLAEKSLALSEKHKEELLHMLKIRNGFYAFESALHVFPFVAENWFENQDLIRWNLPSTWQQSYGEETASLFAFAEDIFGYQFSSYKRRIVRFDPETGDVEDLCATVEEWAALICQDFNVQTGYPIAHKWQAANGRIRPGNRLAPIYPFVSSQGSYELSNLYEVNALKGMLSRADFARQIKNVADGSKVKLVPTDRDTST
jgi:hypothetical protein